MHSRILSARQFDSISNKKQMGSWGLIQLTHHKNQSPSKLTILLNRFYYIHYLSTLALTLFNDRTVNNLHKLFTSHGVIRNFHIFLPVWRFPILTMALNGSNDKCSVREGKSTEPPSTIQILQYFNYSVRLLWSASVHSLCI